MNFNHQTSDHLECVNDPFWLGGSFCRTGYPVDANPYPDGTTEHTEWSNGYYHELENSKNPN